MYLIGPSNVGGLFLVANGSCATGIFDAFDGTVWDDNAEFFPANYPFAGGVPATSLIPLFPFSSFISAVTDPNGDWIFYVMNNDPASTVDATSFTMSIDSTLFTSLL